VSLLALLVEINVEEIRFIDDLNDPFLGSWIEICHCIYTSKINMVE